MRLNFCAAAWIVVALCSACQSRALPVADDGAGSTAGSAGAGTGIPDAQGGGGTGGGAAGDAGLGGAGGVAGTTGGAGTGGTSGVAGTTGGDAGLGGAGGVAGTAGDAGLGGAGAATGGAGLGGSAGGTGGAAGTAGDMPVCPPTATTGKPCVVGSVCRNVVQCHACSDRVLAPRRRAPFLRVRLERRLVVPRRCPRPRRRLLLRSAARLRPRPVAVRRRHLPDAPALRGGNASLGGGG